MSYFSSTNADVLTVVITIVQRVLHPVLDKLGIERRGRHVGFHAFRHGLASMLVDSAGAAVAQRQLRHSDAGTTLGIYAHIIGSGHIDAMEAIQSQLLPTTNTLAEQEIAKPL
jgi:integrase